MSESRESTAPEVNEEAPALGRGRVLLLLVSMLIIAANGVVYELIIAGYSSFLLGDSIYQFSLTIGVFLSSMGVGSFLSRYVTRELIQAFIAVEVAIGAVGGLAILLLSAAYHLTALYPLVMFSITITLGILIGIEIPLVTRIVKDHGSLRQVIANVLSFDYLGALAGSLAFPLLLLPTFGFTRSSLFIGLLNVLVAVINLVFLHRLLRRPFVLWAAALLVIALLGSGFRWADWAVDAMREKATGERIVHKEHSLYQQLLLTRKKEVLRLYLNGHQQFQSNIEQAYHDFLVHPAMSLASERRNILILGGGDGLALREILKYPNLSRIVMVDIDPQMTAFARNHALMRELNKGAMDDPRLEVRNEDAFLFLRQGQDLFDVVIVDLPSPTNISLSKLYTVEFYRLLRARLAPKGVGAVQCANVHPNGRQAYWSIVKSMRAAALAVRPFHLATGGFALIAKEPSAMEGTVKLTVPTSYLTPDVAEKVAFHWSLDLAEVPAEENRLDSHKLLRYVFAETANN